MNGAYQTSNYYYRYQLDPTLISQFVNININATVTLTSALVICQPVTANSCGSKVETINPGGEQLSKEDIPLPYVYQAFMILWGLVVVYCSWNWGKYHDSSNALHKMIFALGVVFLVNYGFMYTTWYLYSKYGELNMLMVQLYYIISNGALAYQFFVLLVVASGWGVLKRNLNVYAWHMTTCLIVLFYLSLNLMTWISVYFFVLTIICVGLMWYYVLKTVAFQLYFLRAIFDRLGMIERRFERVEDGSYASLKAPIVRKFQLFRAYRMLFITYSLAFIIIEFTRSVVRAANRSPVLDASVKELVITVGSLGLMWLFKLKDFSKYSQIVLDRKIFRVPAKDRLGYDPNDVVLVRVPGCEESDLSHMAIQTSKMFKPCDHEEVPNQVNISEPDNGARRPSVHGHPDAANAREHDTVLIEMDNLTTNRHRSVF